MLAENLTATAQVSPTASFVSMISFSKKPCSILEGAAVLVRPLIRWHQELTDQIPMCCIHVDDVEASPLGAHRCFEMPSLQITDIDLSIALVCTGSQTPAGTLVGPSGASRE